MKTMKALKPQTYKGKRYATGESFPVRRSDIRLLEALGRGEVVTPEPVAPVLPSRFFNYQTTSMDADEVPKPAKRKYVRKAKVEE